MREIGRERESGPRGSLMSYLGADTPERESETENQKERASERGSERASERERKITAVRGRRREKARERQCVHACVCVCARERVLASDRFETRGSLARQHTSHDDRGASTFAVMLSASMKLTSTSRLPATSGEYRNGTCQCVRKSKCVCVRVCERDRESEREREHERENVVSVHEVDQHLAPACHQRRVPEGHLPGREGGGESVSVCVWVGEFVSV